MKLTKHQYETLRVILAQGGAPLSFTMGRMRPWEKLVRTSTVVKLVRLGFAHWYAGGHSAQATAAGCIAFNDFENEKEASR